MQTHRARPRMIGTSAHSTPATPSTALSSSSTTRRVVEPAAGRPPPGTLLASMVFADVVGSTRLARSLGDHAWRDLLERYHRLAAVAVIEHGGRIVNRTGDGLLALCSGPLAAIRAARALRTAAAGLGLDLRIGIHTAEVEPLGPDVAGLGVHVGARVAQAAAAGEIWVSRTVRDLVGGSGLVLLDRGDHALAGLDEPWQLYAIDLTEKI